MSGPRASLLSLGKWGSRWSVPQLCPSSTLLSRSQMQPSWTRWSVTSSWVSDPAAPGKLYFRGLCQGAVEFSGDWRGGPCGCNGMKGIDLIYKPDPSSGSETIWLPVWEGSEGNPECFLTLPFCTKLPLQGCSCFGGVFKNV